MIVITTEQAKQWIKDAYEDGWWLDIRKSAAPRYYVINREGWYVEIKAKDQAPTTRYKIEIIAPDGGMINIPVQYNWQTLQRELRICEECGQFHPTTFMTRMEARNPTRMCKKCRDSQQETE